MRALHYIHASLLDFVENSRTGTTLFKIARFGLFAMIIFVGSRVAAHQFLGFGFSDVLFMGITFLVFLLIYWQWELGIVLVLASTSFIAYYNSIPTLSLYHFIPEIPVLEHLRLVIGQGIMLFLLAVFATSAEARTVRQRLDTPLAAAVLVFMIAVFIAAMLGLVFTGVHLPKMVETSRSYSFYLMFFVTLLCVRTRREMRVLLGTLFAMAIVVAILMFLQFALGTERRVFIGSGIRVETFGGYAGRILPPGVELIWLTVPFVIAMIPLVSRRMSRILTFGLAILVGGLLLTFTRSVWMGTLWSMVLMAILGKGAIRRGVTKMFVALVIFVALLLVGLQFVSTDENNYMTPYVKRFTSIFKPEEYAEGTSAGARWMEIREAWPHILKNPVFGLGVGATYRYEDAWDDYAQFHYKRPVAYIHNAYVLLLKDTGLVGFTTCMFMFIMFFVRARKILRRLDRVEDKAIVTAGIGAIASVLLASIMQPSLWYPPAVPCIGTVMGLVEVTRYLRERELRDQQSADAMSAVASRRRGLGLAGAPAAAAGRAYAARDGWRSAPLRFERRT